MNKRDKLVQEVRELALISPVVLASIREHQKGHSTWEEAMMIAVKVLLIQKNTLEKELVRMKNLSVEPMIFGVDWGKGKSKSVKAVYRKDELGAVILDHIEPELNKVTLDESPSEAVIDAAKMLLARIQDEKGMGFWGRKPSTDLEQAAQALAKLIPPE